MRSHSLGTEDVDPHEEKALAAGLSYVALDGNNLTFSNYYFQILFSINRKYWVPC